MAHTGRSDPRSTIGLAMIVRDESAVIGRCLASVMPLIDTWTIVDTGSTDATQEIISDTLGAIPGKLYERPWFDFGRNRSELMTLARNSADYLLLVDADMTIRLVGDLPTLGGDGYRLTHEGATEYQIPRLVRGDVDWRFVGATHEYLDGGPDHAVTETLDAIRIVHHADGGSRADKFERDRALLERAVHEDPGDARSWFYLAQTRADMGDTTGAIDAYRQRIALGGWAEELFVARLRIGDLLAGDDWDRAVAEYVAAWEARPTRAEALYRLARGHRIRGQNHAAELFATKGLTIPFPDDILFVEREAYDWGLLFEHSIAAYWCGDPAGSIAASEALADRPTPAWLQPWIDHNVRAAREVSAHDGRPLLLQELVADARIERIDVDPDLGGSPAWSVFNPGIAAVDGGFAMILRRSNYVLADDGSYRIADASGVVRTRNVLRRLDADRVVIDERVLDEVPPGPPIQVSQVSGVEDARMVVVDDHWYGLGCCRDRNAELRCQVVLWDLGHDGDPATAADPPLRILKAPTAQAHEKNWMPFVADGALHVVHTCDPLVILRVDVTDATTTAVTHETVQRIAGVVRGGSGGVEHLPGRWVFVVHEVGVAPGGSGRSYLHRFVEIAVDPAGTFRLAAVSPPFSFTGARVEFCAGLAQDRDDLVATFGVGDARAFVATVPADAVRSLLEPVR